jgi:hypothetical protein
MGTGKMGCRFASGLVAPLVLIWNIRNTESYELGGVILDERLA